LGLAYRRFSYAYFKKPDKLPAKVISIGNLTLGGTGKTPAVISIAQEAKKRGFTPCVLARGYKGKAKETCFISKGEKPLLNSREAGDEAYLMAEILKGMPVVKGKNRYEAGKLALENFQSEILFILDDGFQHWRLHRDIDVLLIDATDPFGNEKLFPEGIMREPFSAIRRAHFIVITKADVELIKSGNTIRKPLYSLLLTRQRECQTFQGKAKGLIFCAIKEFMPSPALQIRPIFSLH
jgi:tetraacyldisaccharide 4'-kinase